MTSPTTDKDGWGPRIRRRVGQVRRRVRGQVAPTPEQASAAAADEELVRANFDPEHYALQAGDLLAEGTDPVRHFLDSGRLGRFSPHPDFNVHRYLRRYPARRQTAERSLYLEWLKRGRAAGEIGDPAGGVETFAEVLDLDPGVVVDRVRSLREDTRARLRSGTLGEMFAKAIELEPLIGDSWSATAQIAQLPLRNDSVGVCAAAIHDAHRQADFRRARVVVAVDGPRADDLDVLVVSSLAAGVDPGQVVVVYTGAGPGDRVHRLPAGVRVVDFHHRFAGLGWVSDDDREQALVALLRSFWADALVNIESALFHDMLAPYAKALLGSERIFLTFGADPDGRPSAAALHWLYPTIEYAEGLLVPTAGIRDALDEHFQLTAPYLEKLHVLGADGDPGLAARVLREEARS